MTPGRTGLRLSKTLTHTSVALALALAATHLFGQTTSTAPAQADSPAAAAAKTSGIPSLVPAWGNPQRMLRDNAASTARQQGTTPTTRLDTRVVQPESPTQFEVLVAQTFGARVPIFGENLFSSPASTFAPDELGVVTDDYVLGTGDELQITLSGQVNQSNLFEVDRNGEITLPDIGPLRVAGMRFGDLKPYLQQQIGRVYRNFDVSVTMGALRSIQVYVLGEVRTPGAYTVSSLSTMINALMDSGGPLPQGSLRHVQLRRDGKTITDLDLYDFLLRGDKSQDAQLRPGDIIFIPAAGPQVAIVGAVTNPAIYELRGEASVDDLVKLANGFTPLAVTRSVRVESIYNRRERLIENVNLPSNGNMPLQNGDIVTVDSIVDRYKDAVTLRGNVTSPGRYVWHQGMTLSDLLPDMNALITRDYYRNRNALGKPVLNFQYPELPGMTPGSSMQGHLAVETRSQRSPATATGSTGVNGSPLNGQTAASGNQAAAQNDTTGEIPLDPTEMMYAAQNQSAQQSAAPAANAPQNAGTAAGSSNPPRTTSPGGTTIGEALTQGSNTFPARNDIRLSAPDVDLSYAVIERLNPVDLTTSLIPFSPGKLIEQHDTAQNLPLEPGDVVTLFSKADIRVPTSQQTRFVRLEGEIVGAGVYSVQPGETLRQLVARAGGLTPDAYLYASEFTRESTRRIEQQRLQEYADSLELQISQATSKQVAGALDIGTAAAAANVTAENARQAVARLRQARPTGRVVLSISPASSGLEGIPDIPLEDGDRFIIPRRPSTVMVAGQVYSAAAFLYHPKLETRFYLRDAGGPSRDADRNRIFVIRADGSVVSRQYNNVLKATTLPGDTIVVPPRLTQGNVFRDVAAIAGLAGSIGWNFAILNSIHPLF